MVSFFKNPNLILTIWVSVQDSNSPEGHAQFPSWEEKCSISHFVFCGPWVSVLLTLSRLVKEPRFQSLWTVHGGVVKGIYCSDRENSVHKSCGNSKAFLQSLVILGVETCLMWNLGATNFHKGVLHIVFPRMGEKLRHRALKKIKERKVKEKEKHLPTPEDTNSSGQPRSSMYLIHPTPKERLNNGRFPNLG